MTQRVQLKPGEGSLLVGDDALQGTYLRDGKRPNEIVVLWDNSEVPWTIGRDRVVFTEGEAPLRPTRAARLQRAATIIERIRMTQDSFTIQMETLIRDIERLARLP